MLSFDLNAPPHLGVGVWYVHIIFVTMSPWRLIMLIYWLKSRPVKQTFIRDQNCRLVMTATHWPTVSLTVRGLDVENITLAG